MAKKKEIKEEIEEEKVREEAVGEETEDMESVPDEETAVAEREIDESKYAFPMAPIVRLMKDELDKDKMIRSQVKIGMNLWLEKICRKVTKRMNESEYTMVELDDFKTAIEPYELIDDVEGERHRIVATLEKIKQDCDSLIRDVDRKFITYSTQQYLETGDAKGQESTSTE